MLAAVVVAGLVAAVAAPQPEQPAQPEQPVQPERVVTVTESGGLSRGAYDAGVTWAVLRALKATHRTRVPAVLAQEPPARLAVVSGASSGALNSFLAVLSWCDDVEKRERPEDDILYRTWMRISWASLFPGALPDRLRQGVAWSPDDAILTRRAYRGIIAQARADVARGDRKNVPSGTCPLLLAATVTPVETEELQLDGSLPVKAQRFVSVLDIDVEHGRIVFKNDPTVREIRPIGPAWHIGESDRVSFDDVISLVEAGTAFPVTFSPGLLRGYLVARGPPARPRAFVDGGVFDNTPLDLADLLARASLGDGKPLSLIAVDPEHSRGPTDLHAVRPNGPRTRGIAGALKLFVDFVDVARSYELQNLVRRSEGDARLIVADRSSAIVGETMLWFGAFLHREMRRFDFYAGIYDGLVAMAGDLCGGRDDDRCVDDKVAALATQAVDLSPDASWVVRRLMCGEIHSRGGASPAATSFACSPGGKPRSRMLPIIVAASTEILDEDDHDLVDVIDSDGDGIVDARDCPAVERMIDGKCRLARFVQKMKARGALEVLDEMETGDDAPWQQRENEVMRRMLTDWDGFMRGQSFAILDRALTLERADEKAGVSGAGERRRALVVADEALRTWDAVSGGRGLFYLPSTVPADLWPVHFVVPTRMGVAPIRGDVELGWDLVGVDVPARFVPDFVLDAGVRIGSSARLFSGLSARAPLDGLPITGVIGWHASWSVDPSQVSLADAELAAILVDKVRLSLMVEDVPGAIATRHWPSIAFTVGLNDVSGLLVWASRLP